MIVDADSKAVGKGSCRPANLRQPRNLCSSGTGARSSESGKTGRGIQPFTIRCDERQRVQRGSQADPAEVFRPDGIPFKTTGDRPCGETNVLPAHEASDVAAPSTESATNDAPVEPESARIVDAPCLFLRLFVSKQQRIELSLRRGIPRRPRPDGTASTVEWNQYGAERMHMISG